MCNKYEVLPYYIFQQMLLKFVNNLLISPCNIVRIVHKITELLNKLLIFVQFAITTLKTLHTFIQAINIRVQTVHSCTQLIY